MEALAASSVLSNLNGCNTVGGAMAGLSPDIFFTKMAMIALTTITLKTTTKTV